MRIATSTKVNEILRKYQLHAVKQFGQNFIIEPTLVEDIVSKGLVDKDTFVIEIGPGIGSLTEVLIENAGHVVAVELDKKLPAVLNDLFGNCDNFEVIQGDVLKTDLNAIIDKYKSKYKKVKIFGNLPYYITTPILFHIFENVQHVDEVVVMMQKEVAERICASHGDRNFNNLSVACQLNGDCDIILNVGKKVFNPAPNVDSAVVKIKLKDKLDVDYKKFSEFVKICFKQPRKTLYNNLRGVRTIEQIEKFVQASDRPNTVSIENLINIFKEG